MANLIQGLGSIAEGTMRGLAMSRQQEREQKQDDFQQGQRERTVKNQKLDDDNAAAVRDANAAFSEAVQQDQQKWAASGQDPAKYRPTPAMQAQAFDARAAVLRQRGNFDELMKNQAAGTPYYTQARNQAIDQGLARYRSDGDIIGLAQAVYPQIRDGTEIKFAKKLDGGRYEFSLSDGTKQVVSPEEVVGLVTQLRQSPEMAAKMEFERIKEEMQGQREASTAAAKGAQDRLTETQKAESARGLEGVKLTGEKELVGLRNAGAEKVAKIGADSRVSVAEKKAADAESKPPKKLDTDNLHNLVTNAVPDVRGTLDPVTGRYAGTKDSLAITERTQQWLKYNPDMSETEAIRRARNEWQQRQPPKKPGPAGLQ